MRFTSLGLFMIIAAASCTRHTIIHPQKKDIVETVYASGKIIPANEYNLYSLAGGTVIKKLVKDGDSVAQDEVLYVIKNNAPQSRLEAAKTNYQNALSNISSQSAVLNDLRLSMQNARTKFANDSVQYFRLKNLWDQNIGAKNNLDAAYSQYVISKNLVQSAEEKYYSTSNDLNVSLHSAKSQVTDAQTDLSNYYIRSMSNGRVFQTYKSWVRLSGQMTWLHYWVNHQKGSSNWR